MRCPGEGRARLARACRVFELVIRSRQGRDGLRVLLDQGRDGIEQAHRTGKMLQVLLHHAQDQRAFSIAWFCFQNLLEIRLGAFELAQSPLVLCQIAADGNVARIKPESLLEILVGVGELLLHTQNHTQFGKIREIARAELHGLAEFELCRGQVPVTHELQAFLRTELGLLSWPARTQLRSRKGAR